MAGSTIPSSVVNLINNIVGAGLFSMPWCLKEATMLPGTVAFIGICCVNIQSFMLLAECCELTGKFSYLEIGRIAFGPLFGTIAQVATICYAAGSLVSYVVLAGDCLVGADTGLLVLALGSDTFFGGGSELARLAVCGGLGLCVLLPLSLLPTLDALKYASYVALAATIYAVFLVAFELIAAPGNSRADDFSNLSTSTSPSSSSSMEPWEVADSVVWLGFPVGLWSAVPIINVSFTAHYNGPRFYEELRARSLPRFLRTVSLSLFSALLVYLTTAWSGYLVFGDGTLGDVLENFNASYSLAVGARCSLLLIVFASFPKAQHPIRDGCVKFLYGADQSADDLPLQPYAVLTSAIVFVATLVGALCTQVEVVLAYKGGVFGTIIVYLLPPLMRTAVAEQTLHDLTAHLSVDLLASDSDGEGGGVSSGGEDVSASSPRNDARGRRSQQQPQSFATEGNVTRMKVNPLRPPPSPRRQAGYSAYGSGDAAPVGVWQVLCAMFRRWTHRRCALIFAWGVASGCLGVGVTVLKQAGVISS